MLIAEACFHREMAHIGNRGMSKKDQALYLLSHSPMKQFQIANCVGLSPGRVSQLKSELNQEPNPIGRPRKVPEKVLRIFIDKIEESGPVNRGLNYGQCMDEVSIQF